MPLLDVDDGRHHGTSGVRVTVFDSRVGLWDGRASVAFIGLAIVSSLWPDIDLWLSKLAPASVHHHGVTHTVIFGLSASIVVGALVTVLFGRRIASWIESDRFDNKSLFVFSSVAFAVGSLSHLVADMLSAPDTATPIEPFWPFFDKPWAVDVVWYNAWWVNSGLLVTVLVLHVALVWFSTLSEHRNRLTSTT